MGSIFTLVAVALGVLLASFLCAAENGFMLVCHDPLASPPACTADCNWSHNSSQGHCDSQQNCICNNDGAGSGQLPVTGSLVGTPHCQSNASPALISVYERFCELDCICVHGGASHVCDYGRHICGCVYPLGFTSSIENQATCVKESGFNIATCLLGALTTNQVPAGCGAP